MLHWLLAQFIAVYYRLVGRKEAVAVPPVEAAADLEAVHLPDVEPVAAAAAAPVEWSERELVLDVEGLTKSFGGLVAVNDVSFHVRKGAIHAIIGPNGAGKTTLFNLITGLTKPDRARSARR